MDTFEREETFETFVDEDGNEIILENDYEYFADEDIKTDYVPIVNKEIDENNLENKEYESYIFNVDKVDKKYLQYNVDEFSNFIKNILEECPNIVENYIDEYDNFNEDYKQYPIWFLMFINPEFSVEHCKILVQNCKFIEPFSCYKILSQLENTDEDPYHYVNLYIKVWNAFDLYNSPVTSQLIDYIKDRFLTDKDGEYDYPCMMEFMKIVLALEAGPKPAPKYIIPYKYNEDVVLNFDFIPTDEGGIKDIMDELSVCDEADLRRIEIECKFTKSESQIEFIRMFGPINKCSIETKDENYGGGCRMLTCNCFEFDENENPSDYFYDEACRTCNSQIQDRRHVIRAPLTNGGWLGCFCCYKCAYIGIDQYYYSNLEKTIMKKLLLFNYKLIENYKIYDKIPDVIFNE